MIKERLKAGRQYMTREYRIAAVYTEINGLFFAAVFHFSGKVTQATYQADGVPFCRVLGLSVNEITERIHRWESTGPIGEVRPIKTSNLQET